MSCVKVLVHSRFVITQQPGQATEEALTTDQVGQLKGDILFVHSASDAWKSRQENPHSEGGGCFVHPDAHKRKCNVAAQHDLYVHVSKTTGHV